MIQFAYCLAVFGLGAMVDALEVRRLDRTRIRMRRWLAGAAVSATGVVLVGLVIVLLIPPVENALISSAALAFIAGWLGASAITGEEGWLLNRFHQD